MQIFINYTCFWKQKIVHFEVFYEKSKITIYLFGRMQYNDAQAICYNNLRSVY